VGGAERGSAAPGGWLLCHPDRVRPREAATVLVLLLVVAVVGTLIVAVAIPALRAAGQGAPGSSPALPSLQLPSIELPSLPIGSPGATASPQQAATLIAAGDIASCRLDGDSATATLLDRLPGTIAALGDTAYESGTPREFSNCYEPTWGRHRDRTRPAIGNHEYGTDDGRGYFEYFGLAAGKGGEGWYSYELGEWHVVVLNSNCGRVSCERGSPQLEWLEADLAASDARCTLAYWHHPRFSSGTHGSSPKLQPFWAELHADDADLVLVGHDHDYERFAPLGVDGDPDAQTGIREFVVGTGGAALRDFESPVQGSEVRESDTHGVLQLTLGEGRYEWRFVPVEGESFTDSGSGSCH
jgi:hypothetical protein